MWKYLASCTDIPYQPSAVNRVANNETAKITEAPYQAGTVNYATMNKMAKITDTIFVGTCSGYHQQYKDKDN